MNDRSHLALKGEWMILNEIFLANYAQINVLKLVMFPHLREVFMTELQWDNDMLKVKH